ncbi:MAG TPA: VOC family protein [Flavobacteriaceae bacterium]|nr:VOC family protein [Flavobacteriaceae bacterium]MCB9213674.1 VOC family protein [Alteromonas sp.]HPF12176.1 VOC family protein [Flavobacteriaceae bacterium]HQU22309.1 VOC family protein [Flavobacteriaceae bacterium]HQU66005.1 VOC family protein [Flavobacteriaceae bacterium]
MPHPFHIDFLDHVALRVRDLEVSVAWYEKVLGLKKYQLPEWGPFPIFMLSGKSGVVLFPARLDDPALDATSRNVKLDHFAFNLSRAAFEKAQQYYEALGLDYQLQNHHYFDSLYTHDPDGHTVELTTLKVPEKNFYRLD